MKCSKAHKLIPPYIDRELSERELSVLEDHIKVCEKCRTELEEMKGMHLQFVNAEKFEAPYGFKTRVMANINTSKSRRVSQKEPFDILYFTPAITLIANMNDRRFSLSPEFVYTRYTNLELRLKAIFLAGERNSEFDEKQNNYRVELRVRYYF